MITHDGIRLKWKFDAQTLWVEPWGENSRLPSARSSPAPEKYSVSGPHAPSAAALLSHSSPSDVSAARSCM